MKILIIEDEKPASRRLIRLLNEIRPDIEIMDVLASVEKSVNRLFSGPKPDLIFMDIQLEDGISFEIFENIEVKTPVIFTTAYDEYTLKAFKVNSVDYLLKPVSGDDLKKAMDKFETFYDNREDYKKTEYVLKELQSGYKERFLIRIGEHYRSIPTNDISAFYIKERFNFILDNKGKSHPLDYSLDKIEKITDPRLFFRVSRNFIINFNSIKDIISYSSGRLKLVLYNYIEDDGILVSRERVADFKKWLDR